MNGQAAGLAYWFRRFWLPAAFGAFVAVSFAAGYAPGRAMALSFAQFAREMASFLPLMFVLVGLFDVWVPKEWVLRHVGPGSGAAGTLWVILLATLQAGPLYGAFPVAAMLWKKGCSRLNVFVYLSAFSAMKVPMVTFEVGFLGWRFSLLRLAFTLPVFLALAAIQTKLTGRSGFEVTDGSSPSAERV